METCYTVTEIPRDSHWGAEPRCLPETRFLRRPNPQQRPGAALAALAALAAGRWPHSLTAELGRRGSGPQGGSPSRRRVCGLHTRGPRGRRHLPTSQNLGVWWTPTSSTGAGPPAPGPSGLRDSETPQNHEFTATHSRGRSCHPVRLPP